MLFINSDRLKEEMYNCNPTTTFIIQNNKIYGKRIKSA